MSVAEILNRAQSLGIRLRVDGEVLKMSGPGKAREAVRGEMVAHKPEILAYLREAANDGQELPVNCTGPLMPEEGAPFWPWCPNLSPEVVHGWRAELAAAIRELAATEHWPQTLHDAILERAMRDPLTAWPDNVAHFGERLAAARAEAQAREVRAARCWHAPPKALASRQGKPERSRQ